MPPNDFSRYEGNPVGFFEDVLGFSPSPPQLQIVDHLLTNRVTNVQAGHGVGKTHLSAALVLWWVFARESLAITTAPTNRQVKELLWGEIRRFYDHNQQTLGGSRLEMSVHVSETARAYGFTASHYSVDSFQGIHSPRAVLVIEDEANGISGAIDDGAIACTTGYSDRLLRVGNPVTKGTSFFDACSTASVKLPIWGHPNVSPYYQQGADGVHRLRPGLSPPYNYPVPGAVSVEWIESVRESKGEDSPYWVSRLCAEFPDSNSASVIPSHLWDSAIDNFVSQTSPYISRYGVDVGGRVDDHAIAEWRNKSLLMVEAHSSSKLSTLNWADYIVSIVSSKVNPIWVDRVGVGLGTLDRLLQKYPKHYVRGVSNGDPSPSPEYKNLVTYAAWTLRLALQRGEITVAPLPDMDLIIEEFDATEYVIESDKRIALEAKDKTKAKLGRSPDRRDAILMGWIATNINIESSPRPSINRADLYRAW